MKKKDKPNNNRKPRIPIIGIDFDKDVEISYINIDENKRVIFRDENGNLLEPSTVSIADGYNRLTKPKVLRQIQSDPLNILLDTKKLFKKYDGTLVVDTNYYDIEGYRICVSASILILYEEIDLRRNALLLPQDCLLFCTKSLENPEKYGWWDIIDRFSNSKIYNPDGFYGIVVDSELGSLPDINKRTLPIWSENTLPSNFQILYASADAGQENYINQTIRKCDKLASKVLKGILPLLDINEIRKNLQISEYFKYYYLKYSEH